MRETEIQRQSVTALRAAGWHVTVTASDKRNHRQ